MNKKILIIAFLMIITITSVLIIKSTSKTKTPAPPTFPPTMPPTMPPTFPPTMPPTMPPTFPPTPSPNQTFTLTNYAFTPTFVNVIKLKFARSGKIKSFTSNILISTDTTSYRNGTTLVFTVYRGDTLKYLDSFAVHFPANTQSSNETKYAVQDITVQEGDLFYIAGNGTSGTLNGTVTVNFF